MLFPSYFRKDGVKMFINRKRKIINKIIEENIDYLFRFAFYRIGNREDAEDIVYEAILKFLERKPDEINPESVRLYLFRIVYNLCNDKQRAGKLDRVMIEEVEIEDETSSPLESEDFERVNSYLKNIKPNEADVIRMNVIGDLSFVEISKIMSIPQSTAKSRFKSGMEKLRRLISDKRMS